MDIYKEYLSLKNEIDEKKKRLEELKEKIVEQGEEKEVDGNKIKIIKSRKTVLKKGVDKENLIKKYPDAVKKDLDLSKLPSEAHPFLEEKENSYVKVTQRNNDKEKEVDINF